MGADFQRCGHTPFWFGGVVQFSHLGVCKNVPTIRMLFGQLGACSLDLRDLLNSDI